MKLNLRLLYLLPLLLVLVMSGCRDNDPEDENDPEVITKVMVTVTDASSNSTAYVWSDPDGDGAGAPTIDDITLMANSEYTVAITFADESDPNDIEDITAEILEEDDEHIICFTPENAMVAVTIDDTDGSFPVGLSSTWTTTDASTGTINIVLKHQPGVKDGTCTPGETDIDVTFNVDIQ